MTTYLVLLVGGMPLPMTTALVLYRGDDEAAAQTAYADGVRMERDRASFPHVPKGTVYLTTVHSEAKLS